jgi:hypothetical protein
MAIQPISAGSLEALRAAAAASRQAAEVTPDAREAMAQETDARRVAESDRGAAPAYLRTEDTEAAAPATARAPVVPVAADPVGSMARATQALERAYGAGSPTPGDLRAAEEAYRAEAAARDDLARQEQGGGARSIDVTV